MKKLSKLLTMSAAGLMAMGAQAADLEIKITNLTQGVYFTPFIIAAHSDDANMYQVGMAASTELQAIAEGGDISGMSTLLTGISADIVENPAEGMLAPGASTETMLMSADTNTVLSLVSMLLPTNDGFVGLDSWSIPSEAGTYTMYLKAYDAGTEANDEIVNDGGAPGTPGIPKDPGMKNGTGAMGVTDMEETQVVHIHRGVIGDTDDMGGYSDLDSTAHRWLNPVAKITITVN